MGNPVRVVLGGCPGRSPYCFPPIFSRGHGWQSLSVSKCKSRRVDFVFCSTQAVGKPVRVVLRGGPGRPPHLFVFEGFVPASRRSLIGFKPTKPETLRGHLACKIYSIYMRRLLSAFFLIWPFSYLYFLMSEGGSGHTSIYFPD